MGKILRKKKGSVIAMVPQLPDQAMKMGSSVGFAVVTFVRGDVASCSELGTRG